VLIAEAHAQGGVVEAGGGVGEFFDKITNEDGSNCNRVNEEN